jgi:C-terminal processing protease CtpA/Prc
MKRVNYLIIGLLAISLLFTSCSKNDDPAPVIPPSNVDFTKVEVEDFIWKGMNAYYYWKDFIPNLDNSKINNTETYFNMLNAYTPNPDDFFDSLLYQPETVDVFSWITDDYVAQDEGFQGIVKSNGVVYRLSYETGSSTNLLGYVRYILPNSDAAGKDVKRGYVFNAIDGVQLTIGNYQELMARDTYTMHFADLNGGNPISNGKTVELTQVENFKENPVHITKSFDVNGTKIGYLMFNAFDGGWNSELNAAFGQLKADGVTELVLDLRYNRGGYNSVAMNLASLITGQFPGEVVSKQKWNSELMSWFNENHPDWLLDTFVDKISYTDDSGNTIEEPLNNLNLTNLVVITTGSTASASESVISGLRPYISVSTIGTLTYGKYTGSITVYDSDNFSKTGDNFNTNHTWALQPIVFEYMNSVGQNVKGGIVPTIEKIEYVSEFKELGTLEEPLLAEAIAYITGSGKPARNSKIQRIQFDEIENKLDPKYGRNGYVTDKTLPTDFFERIK